ncbi:MAG: 50S ribosomal protein L10 [Acidimicrobiales bacterium]
MAGPRAEKVAVVEEVKDHLERADAAILTEYRGLKVSDLATLRRALRSAGAEYKIYKNTLVRRATAATGNSGVDSMLEGPTAIAFVDADVAAVAKVLRDFARTNPALVVKGSLVSGSVLDARSTALLADLPSRDTLLSMIAGALAAPMQQFASLLKALPQNFAYGISAVIDQKRAAGDTSGDAAVADVAESADSVAESAPATEETVAGSDTSVAAEAPPAAAEADEASAADAAEAAADESPTAEAEAEEAPAADAAADESAAAEAVAEEASVSPDAEDVTDSDGPADDPPANE